MAQRIIGLDIGSWSIKAMVMESSLRRVSFVDLREHHLPVDAHGMPLPGELSAAVRAVLAGLDVDVLTIGVPGVQVLLRELTLPFGDDKRVSPVLGFQLESLLPRPIETMVYDWHVLEKGPDGAQLLCAAADKEWFEGWLAELREGGAEPRHLTLSTLAIDNLTPHIEVPQASEGPVAVIDLGHRSTQVTLLEGGKVKAIRALARGGHQVTQALARTLGLAYADAEHIKHHELDLSGALPPGVDADEHAHRIAIAARALEPILRELKMTVAALTRNREQGAITADTRLAGVVLCGGMSRLPGIAVLIERLLAAPMIDIGLVGPIWERLAVGEGPEGPRASGAELTDVGLVPAALALEHVRDSDPHRINIRHGSMALSSDFGALRARAGLIAAFIALLLVIFFVRKAIRVSTLSDQEELLAARLDEYEEQTLGTKPDHEIDTKLRFEMVRDMVLTPPGSETDEVYPTMTAFNIFYEATRIQKVFNDEAARVAAENAAGDEEEPEASEPGDEEEGEKSEPEKHQVELSLFSADLKSAQTGQAKLVGVAYDIVTVEAFVDKLGEHPCFEKVDQQDAPKNSNPEHPGWESFQLKITVKCEQPPSTSGAVKAGGAVADTAGEE